MTVERLVPAAPVYLEREPVAEDELRAAGVDIDAQFPGSSIDDFRKYPVLARGGWFMVIKHMPTLTSVVREPWDLLGPVRLTSSNIEINQLAGVKTPVAES